jgi:hypothetical protein
MADRDDEPTSPFVDRSPSKPNYQILRDQSGKATGEPQSDADLERQGLGARGRDTARRAREPSPVEDAGPASSSPRGDSPDRDRPDQDGARRRAELRAAVMPYMVNDFGRTLVTGQHSAPPDRRADGSLDLLALARDSRKAEAQRSDEAALGRADAATLREDPAARAKSALNQARDQAHGHGDENANPDRGQEGPTRASGRGVERPRGTYNSLG